MIRIGDKVYIEIDGYDCTAVIVEKKALPVSKQIENPNNGISNFDEEWYS
jgi:hypothetical protein